jgi:predicted ATP-grasp superfamily ATP-dependent carboligase
LSAPTSHPPRVLITDGHWAKTLAATRSLGKRGIRVTVGESTAIATTFFSRYCAHRLVYPSPQTHPEAFITTLIRELKRRPYTMVLPMEERTTLLLARYREELEPLTFLPLTDFASLDRARRKDEVLKLAGRLGVPAPATVFPQELAEVRDQLPRLPVPAVIKPRLGSGSTGILYVRRREDLWAAYLKAHERAPLPLIQEYIPEGGPAVGASFLFDQDHRPVAHFVHKRLRQYPLTGGPSTLRESIADPAVRELGERILTALQWYGVAMVEFRYDPRDGLPKLMEINPRFWGSLPLAVYAGVDFPYLIFRMARGESFSGPPEYSPGKRCRWLLPGDLLHFFKSPNRLHLDPGFFRFFEKNTGHDFFSWSDPLPVAGRILTLLTLLYDPDMKRLLRERTGSDSGAKLIAKKEVID